MKRSVKLKEIGFKVNDAQDKMVFPPSNSLHTHEKILFAFSIRRKYVGRMTNWAVIYIPLHIQACTSFRNPIFAGKKTFLVHSFFGRQINIRYLRLSSSR